MSLLADPDPSYVAKYTGENLAYKSADGVSITEFAPASPMKHLICDNSNKCVDANSIKPYVNSWISPPIFCIKTTNQGSEFLI